MSLIKDQKAHDERRDELARRVLKMPRTPRDDMKLEKPRAARNRKKKALPKRGHSGN